MMKEDNDRFRPHRQPLAILYGLAIFVLTLSGFGQMPIFKRYYIADIPGLGWLAQFYVTHYLHYLGAIVLLGIGGYVFTRYLVIDKKNLTLTISGTGRATLLLLLAATGGLLVWRNLESVILPPGFIILLDISHLLLVILFLVFTGAAFLRKQAWLRARKARS